MSCAVKTPIISVSMSRKAAIYSPTRFSIASQLARMQIGIRKTVSAISISAMPSMPIAHAKRPKIGANSVNCHSGAPGVTSNFAQMRNAEQKIDQRRDERDQPGLLRRDEQARDGTEHRHGEHQRQDGKAKLVHFGMIAQVAAAARTNQHHQRIGIKIARLEPAGDLAAGDDQPGHAIGAEAIDRALIAALPEHPAEREGRANEEKIVELVNIPLMQQEIVEQVELRHEPGRPVGVADVGQPGDGEAERHDDERHPFDRLGDLVAGVHEMLVEEERARLPEFRAAFRIHELAEEGEAAKHRADAEQDERDQHDPWALVRMIAAGASDGAVIATMRGMGMVVMAGVFRVRMIVMTVAMGIVHRMLDMLARGPSAACPRR